MRPDGAELRETVVRMEDRLRGEPLFPVYAQLAERFESDLRDERDVLVSKAAVLMFLQEARGEPAPPTGGEPLRAGSDP